MGDQVVRYSKYCLPEPGFRRLGRMRLLKTRDFAVSEREDLSESLVLFNLILVDQFMYSCEMIDRDGRHHRRGFACFRLHAVVSHLNPSGMKALYSSNH